MCSTLVNACKKFLHLLRNIVKIRLFTPKNWKLNGGDEQTLQKTAFFKVEFLVGLEHTYRQDSKTWTEEKVSPVK